MATNRVPTGGIRIPEHELRAFIAALFASAGMPTEHAALMSSILVESDLCGILSHGTRMAPDYIEKLLDGRVNARPNIRVIRDNGPVRVLDGDGGMGHLACYLGTEWAVAEAKRTGLAAVTTCNHHHFGAAGTYARMALERDCIGMAVSSQRITPDQNISIRRANPNSPISVAIPANKEPALVMDQGVWLPWDERFFVQYPFVYFKDLALGAVLHAMGGILAGIHQFGGPGDDSPRLSDQGSFVAVFSIASFMPVDEFKTEIDRFIRRAATMQPFPGTASAELAGGPERRHRRECELNGIPIDADHQASLCEIAARLDVSTPFAEFAQSPFEDDGEASRLSMVKIVRGIARTATTRLFK